MNAVAIESDNAVSSFELHFESLYSEGRGLAFPCDAAGRVELDCMSARARDNYLYARAVIGHEYRYPAVRYCSSR